ncbi:hypothetical protein J132_08094 [Termitomyces sp. J132]|nr:hypothetical protein J132_08094 [Termitomyces sp. J132]
MQTGPRPPGSTQPPVKIYNAVYSSVQGLSPSSSGGTSPSFSGYDASSSSQISWQLLQCNDTQSLPSLRDTRPTSQVGANGASRPPSARSGHPVLETHVLRFSSKPLIPRLVDPSAPLRDTRRSAVVAAIFERDDSAPVLDPLREITSAQVPSQNTPQNGLDVDTVIDDQGHTAHQGGDFKSLVDLQDEHGDTPLNIAAQVGNRSMELSGGPQAEDLLDNLRPGPPAPVQKSQDVIAGEYLCSGFSAPRSLTLDLKTMLMGQEKKETLAAEVLVIHHRLTSIRIVKGDSHPVWEETMILLVGPTETNAHKLLRLQFWYSGASISPSHLTNILDLFTADDCLTPYNSSTEKFIRNWRSTSVRDACIHEAHPLLGVVVLPSKDVSDNEDVERPLIVRKSVYVAMAKAEGNWTDDVGENELKPGLSGCHQEVADKDVHIKKVSEHLRCVVESGEVKETDALFDIYERDNSKGEDSDGSSKRTDMETRKKADPD